MDFLEFLSRSEWPLVASAALWLVRKPLQRMLGEVTPTKVDAWGLKAEFERSLAKVELLAPAVVGKLELANETATLDATGVGGLPPKDEAEVSSEPSIQSPDVAIMQAWRRLEHWVQKLSDAQGQSMPRRFDQAARELGLVADEIAALMELQKLRNRVAHSVDAPVTETEAVRFEAAIERLLKRITDVYIEPSPKGQPETSPITGYVVEDFAGHVLNTFVTQAEAIEWAIHQGRHPHVARVRHLNDKNNPDHWRPA